MSSDTVNRFWLLITIVLIIIIIIGGTFIWNRRDRGQELLVIYDPPAESQYEISVVGAVNNPGTYPVKPEESLNSIIQASGGAGKDADLSRIRLYVPCAENNPPSQQVDINRADIWLLQALPGIGETRAKAIVEYRTRNGLFRMVEDITNVPEIGASVFEKIKPYITVSEN
jgi:competence protein ComEA